MTLENKKNGAFRPRKVYFTQVSNDVLRNNELSLKAKGLYSLISSYITIEGFTLYKNTLKADCEEGESAFDSTWKELKEKGYLKQYKLKDNETKSFYYEYELLEVPIIEEEAVTKKAINGKSRNAKNLGTENLGGGFSTPGKGGVYNNTNLNNTYSMYVCMYEKYLIATKTLKDFIAKNEIHERMTIELFEHLLVEVMNNNRVKKKDKYFLKVLKEISNKGIRTIEEYEKDLEDYKAKNKTKETNKRKDYSKPVKTRFHNINERFKDYEPEDLEKLLKESQKNKFKKSSSEGVELIVSDSMKDLISNIYLSKIGVNKEDFEYNYYFSSTRSEIDKKSNEEILELAKEYNINFEIKNNEYIVKN